MKNFIFFGSERFSELFMPALPMAFDDFQFIDPGSDSNELAEYEFESVIFVSDTSLTSLEKLKKFKKSCPWPAVLIVCDGSDFHGLNLFIREKVNYLLTLQVTDEEIVNALKFCSHCAQTVVWEQYYREKLEKTVIRRTLELSDLTKILDFLTEKFSSMSELDYTALSGQILEIYNETLKIPGGSFYLKEGNSFVLTAEINEYRSHRSTLDLSIESSFANNVLNSLNPVFVEDINDEQSISGSGFDKYTSPSCMGFPIHNQGGELTGLCFLHGFEATEHVFETSRLIWSFASEAFRIKELRNKIATEEAKFRALVDSSPSGIFLHQDGKLLYANERLLDILGYSRQDLEEFYRQGASVFDFIHVQDREIAKNYAIKRAMGEESPGYYELRLIHKSGAIIWCTVSVTALKIDHKVAILGNMVDVTSQKINELKTIENERKYRVLFETAGDAIFLVKKGAILDMNTAACRLFDLPRDEFIGRSYMDFSREKDPNVLLARVKNYQTEVFEKGHSSFDWEFESNGRIIFSEVTLSSFKDEGGTSYLAVLRDVTERKKREQELFISEQRYRSIFENASIGVFKSRGQVFLDVNSALARISGYSSRTHMLESVKDISTDFYCDGTKREQILNAINENKGSIYDFNMDFKKPDGSIFTASVSANAVFNEEGNIDYIEGFIEDVTEKLAYEKMLRENEKKFRELIENAPVGILSVSKDGSVLSANTAILDILGSPSLEATMKINILTFPPLVSSGISQDFHLCFQSGEKILRQALYKSKWGKELILRYRISPIFDETGKVTAAQVIVEDNTLYVKSEEERKKLEAQLNQSQKLEAVGRLAGGIAHDFNNILTSITANASLGCMDLKENDPLRENLVEILETSDRASRLTRQLLAFSRKQIIETRIVDINEVIQNILNLISRLIGEDVELKTVMGKNLAPVQVDTTQIEQVIVNLVVNSRQAMPRGGMLIIETSNYRDPSPPMLTTRTDFNDDEDFICISVSDTGSGIDSETMQHIFEPFFSTKSKENSSGLGLATTWGIVKQHGGYITVNSQLEAGTVFRVFLPAAQGKPTAISGNNTSMKPEKGSGCILLVEDDKSVINVVSKLLRRLGYTVHTASSGIDALLKYKNSLEIFDLVLTDIIMPEMSGIEMATQIIELQPDMEILFSSGYSEDYIESMEDFKGSYHFISKPYNIKNLAELIQRILTGKRK